MQGNEQRTRARAGNFSPCPGRKTLPRKCPTRKKRRSLPRCHGNGRACPGQLAWRREEREPEQSCGQDIGAFVLPQEYGIDSREDTGSLPTNGSCATDATADGAVAQRACPSASSMMDRLALPRDIGVWQWKRTGLFGLDLGLRTWTPAPGTPMPTSNQCYETNETSVLWPARHHRCPGVGGRPPDPSARETRDQVRESVTPCRLMVEPECRRRGGARTSWARPLPRPSS